MVAKETAAHDSTAGSGRDVADGGTSAEKAAAERTATGNPPAGEGAAAEPGTGPPVREAGTKKTATGNPPPEETVSGAAPAKRTSSKKATAKKTAAGKTAARKTAKKAAAKKTAAGRTAAAEAAAEGAAADTSAGTSTARKAAPPEGAVPAKKTGAKTVVAKKTPGGAPAAALDDSEQTAGGTALPKARTGPASAAELPVRPGEDPWSEAEAEEARSMLRAEQDRLRNEIRSSEDAIAGLMRDSSDSTGDEADTGSKNITREHEMALASNAREMLLQTERALERLDAGTYGLCENCGKAIGKARMQAFPRATLCVECKQKTERR
ncbi:TraR/DksA family transcriptional regulator [Streptomyces sp. NPDC042319]|uniref:TraR/DksA family transcriptional regulator n=1 Tax=Streptomyces sp. NPDC042319 TaxID=3154332 RepID=UPI00340FCE66